LETPPLGQPLHRAEAQDTPVSGIADGVLRLRGKTAVEASAWKASLGRPDGPNRRVDWSRVVGARLVGRRHVGRHEGRPSPRGAQRPLGLPCKPRPPTGAGEEGQPAVHAPAIVAERGRSAQERATGDFHRPNRTLAILVETEWLFEQHFERVGGGSVILNRRGQSSRAWPTAAATAGDGASRLLLSGVPSRLLPLGSGSRLVCQSQGARVWCRALADQAPRSTRAVAGTTQARTQGDRGAGPRVPPSAGKPPGSGSLPRRRMSSRACIEAISACWPAMMSSASRRTSGSRP
jgi:hypothetical protein